MSDFGIYGSTMPVGITKELIDRVDLARSGAMAIRRMAVAETEVPVRAFMTEALDAMKQRLMYMATGLTGKTSGDIAPMAPTGERILPAKVDPRVIGELSKQIELLEKQLASKMPAQMPKEVVKQFYGAVTQKDLDAMPEWNKLFELRSRVDKIAPKFSSYMNPAPPTVRRY